MSAFQTKVNEGYVLVVIGFYIILALIVLVYSFRKELEERSVDIRVRGMFAKIRH